MSWAGEITGNGSGIMFVMPDGVQQIPTGAEGTYLKIEDGYPKFINVVPTGNAGLISHIVLSQQQQAAGTTLSFTVPSGTLAYDGDELQFYFAGTNSDANPVMEIRYGGSLVLDGTLLGLANSLHNGFGWIRRTGPSSQVFGVSATAGAGSTCSANNGTLALSNNSNQTLSLLTAVAGAGGLSRALSVYKITASGVGIASGPQGPIGPSGYPGPAGVGTSNIAMNLIWMGW